MAAVADSDLDLAGWLQRIQQLHPNEIDMGLERLAIVARRLDLQLSNHPAKPLVITVTGTNGKGSHVAVIDAVLRAAGKRVGCYTSPHLLHYNERVCIQGEAVADAMLVDAFTAIEQARGDISLTYFEFGTLAALMIFADADLDAMVLEVGLGGRLDAVNLMDADIAVVTSIGLDHQEWLGDTREEIAIEKAGIFRPRCPVVCTETDPPATLIDAARALECPLYLAGRDFQAEVPSRHEHWSWQGHSSEGDCVINNLPIPALAPANVAGALQAACLTGMLPAGEWLKTHLPAILLSINLPGRQQWFYPPQYPVPVIMDVAHNPQAGQALAGAIARQRERPGHAGKKRGAVRAVLAMMADKDHQGFYSTLENQVDFWYIAHFDLPRCLSGETLMQKLLAAGARQSAIAGSSPFATVSDALAAACSDAGDGDIIVVTGSFITVSDAMLKEANTL